MVVLRVKWKIKSFLNQCLPIFWLLLLSFTTASDDFVASPCRNTFQFGLDSNKQPVGIIDLTVPKYEVYQINVTAVFLLQTSNVDKFPKLSLTSRDNVINSVLSGKPIRLISSYDQSDFRLYSILLNDKEVCKDTGADGSNYKVRASDTYTAPIDEISQYKSHFPIKYNTPECGVPKHVVDDKKYVTLSHGGERADWNDWPWITSIYISNQYVCTGNLISRSVLVTAAHCFGNKTVSNQRIKIGLFNNQNATIWGYLRHSSHNEYKDDIALVYLSEDITDPNFVPVCISLTIPRTTNGAIVSFGEDEFGQTGNLNFLSINSVTNSVCRNSNAELARLVQDTHFCGGNSDGTGPCFGDSGAGWLFKQNQKWTLRGLVSASLKDEQEVCDTKNYAIFIDVVQYMNWIPGSSGMSPTDFALEGKRAQPLVTGSCGGLASPVDDFISNKKWIVTVEVNSWSWFGILISPQHVLTDILPKYSKDPTAVGVQRGDFHTNITKISRIGPKWYHPTVLKLSQPITDTSPVCIDNVGLTESEEAVFVDTDITLNVPKAERTSTITRSSECFRQLIENKRFKTKGTYSAEGISSEIVYCPPTDGFGELVLQKHNNGQQEYWSLFGYWLLENSYTSVSEYRDAIVAATKN